MRVCRPPVCGCVFGGGGELPCVSVWVLRLTGGEVEVEWRDRQAGRIRGVRRFHLPEVREREGGTLAYGVLKGWDEGKREGSREV